MASLISVLIIVVLELGPIACESNVTATLLTCNMFFVIDSRARVEPNVANPPFPKKKKRNLKFANYLGVPWIQQILVIMKLTSNNNCSKQCEGKNLMKLTFNIWGHPWQDLCHA